MKKRYNTVILGIAAALALFVILARAEGLLAAWGEDWPMASTVTALSQTLNLKQRSALALKSSTRAAAMWSEEGIGAKLSTYDGVEWDTPPQILRETDVDIFWPTLAYSGTELLAAWVEDEISSPSSIIQMDVSTRHTETVMSGIIGMAVPKLAVGPDKAHLVFVHAENLIETDLYYTSRLLSKKAWAAPTKVITHSQVTLPATGGKIFFPQLALSQDGQTIHIVWAQEYNATKSRSIWYVEGNWTGSTLEWESPQQISPAGELGMRPNLIVDSQDRVHIVWARPTPNIVTPEEQDVLYKRLGTSGVVQLNDLPVQVNDKFPTVAEFSIAMSGSNLCITWHGLYGSINESEEVWMRCSADEGASWQDVRNASTSPDKISLFGNVRLDNAGSAYVTWVEFQIDNNEKKPLALNARIGPSTFKQVFLPLVMR
jgi:hypothetical protein